MIKNYTKGHLTTNLKDFKIYMEEIDQKLIKKNITIPRRPMLAILEISKDLNCSIAWEETFGKMIFAWYDEKYDKRLLMDFCIGKMVILINNVPFLVKFPLIFGKVKIYPLEWIKDITPNFFEFLNEDKLVNLANFILNKYNIFQEISKYISMSDLENAINQIMNQNPDYGQSKWSSLLIAEKMLKKYITDNGGQYNYNHNLKELLKTARSLGLIDVQDDLIKKIQCKAEVRYNNTLISLDDAVSAHQASIELSRMIVNSMNKVVKSSQ